MSNSLEASRPWYRQPWLWFILTPLIAVFIVGTSFAYLSVVTFDGMVKGDYAKTAKSFNIDASRLTQAKALDLHAELTLDAVTGDLRLRMTAKDTFTSPQLMLEVIHPTVVELDQDLILALRPDGNYYGTLNKNIDGKRYLHLSDQENTWRMMTEVHTPWAATVAIVPNQP
ncbi:MAG TPA: hypothetical protein DE179_08415 [Oceanospirillaceae bacterium]|nr:hypothetical protein [Oceanospirillaceae bacterium]